MIGSLFLLQAQSHLAQVLLRAATLTVAAPVHLLKLVQKRGGAIGVARDGARLHVRDALPGLGVLIEVFFVRRLRLQQRTRASVRAQTSVHGEHHARCRCKR